MALSGDTLAIAAEDYDTPPDVDGLVWSAIRPGAAGGTNATGALTFRLTP